MSPPLSSQGRGAALRLLRRAVAPSCAALLLGPPLRGQEADLAALVNPRNAVRDLTRSELTRIFRAETRYWKGGRRIELLMPHSGTIEKDFLLRHVYRMDEAELKRYWIELIYQNKIAAPPKVMPSPAVTQVVLGKQDGGLGLVPAPEVRAEGPAVLAIEGRSPGDPDYWLRPEKPRDGAAKDVRDASVKPDDDDLRQRVELLEMELAALGSSQELQPTFEFGSLQLRGFGDVTLELHENDAGDGAGEFALGQLDLFLTAQLSERSSFLSEVVFEADSAGETVADLERFVVSYDIGASSTLRAGRIHTALGLWNGRFHHGEWLQTTIERPGILQFEDEGGLLPVHLVGASLEYRAPWETLGLAGFLQVGNGRGPTPDPPQSAGDANDSKCVNVQVTLTPAPLPGLVFGGGLYLDEIPANTDASAGPLHGALEEQILSAFASWSSARTSVLGEYYHLSHDGGGSEASSDGWFVQIEREYGDWTPYARLEALSIDETDTFFGSTLDQERVVLGVRWDFSTWNAIKLQLESGKSDEASGEDFRAIRLQTAFAF